MTIEETKQYFENFPEAPASDTFRWSDPQGFEHMLTLRAWHIKPLLKAIGEAQAEILVAGGKPAGQSVKPAPVATVQERGDDGLPVIDGEGQPVLIALPANTHVFTVKGFYHGQNKDKTKDFLKVVVEEKPYSGKYGHPVFHPPFAEWKTWPYPADGAAPGLFAADPKYGHVVIRDPEGDGKFPEIVEFRE
jgi:hypothetical protein